MTQANDQHADDKRKDLSRIKEILFSEDLQGLNSRLGELRDELASIIENQVKILEEKLDAQEAAHKKQMEAIAQQLEEEKKEMQEELKKLAEAKVNKTEIAELFGLMIQKLK